MNDNILEYAAGLVKQGTPVALVTVTATSGSSPATVGQMMAVTYDGANDDGVNIVGTIGGGASENHVAERAIEAIKNKENTFSLSIDHSEEGMSCGGSMEVFGNVLGIFTGLCVFGGGHIAQSLAKLAEQTGFYVTVVEDRISYAKQFHSSGFIVCNPEDFDKKDPAKNSDFAVICTRGHETDDAALRYCLQKDLKYIGMIGSKKKVTELFAKLEAEGISQSKLAKVYAPIGLDIASSIPSEIAIAILAEILLIKNNGNLNHKTLRW